MPSSPWIFVLLIASSCATASDRVVVETSTVTGLSQTNAVERYVGWPADDVESAQQVAPTSVLEIATSVRISRSLFTGLNLRAGLGGIPRMISPVSATYLATLGPSFGWSPELIGPYITSSFGGAFFNGFGLAANLGAGHRFRFGDRWVVGVGIDVAAVRTDWKVGGDEGDYDYQTRAKTASLVLTLGVRSTPRR